MAAALAVATVLLGGCSDDGGQRVAEPTTTSTATTLPTAAPVAPPVLLDRGAEPRRPLRMELEVGDETTLQIVTDLVIDQVAGGRRQRLDSPPVTQVVRAIVTSVDVDGADVELEVEAVTLDAEGTDLTADEATELQDALDPLVGLRGSTTIDALGRSVDATFEAPAGLGRRATDLLDALARQLPGIGPALPLEAVGLGASWRSTSNTEVDTGAAVTATSATIVTVTGLEGTRLTYTAHVTTSAEPQDLAIDGSDGTTQARLTSSDLEGDAEGAIVLDGLDYELRSRSSGPQTIDLTGPEGTSTVTQELTLATRVAPVPD